MPQGYYTIEQCAHPKGDGPARWLAGAHLPFGRSLTAAEEVVKQLGELGFYRLVHAQRVIWAEKAVTRSCTNCITPARSGRGGRFICRARDRFEMSPTERGDLSTPGRTLLATSANESPPHARANRMR